MKKIIIICGIALLIFSGVATVLEKDDYSISYMEQMGILPLLWDAFPSLTYTIPMALVAVIMIAYGVKMKEVK